MGQSIHHSYCSYPVLSGQPIKKMNIKVVKDQAHVGNLSDHMGVELIYGATM